MKYALIISLIAGPLAAQEFSLPAGCEAFLTVQSRDCHVDHHFRCARDPVGHQSRVSLSEDGMVYMGTTDSEAQWIISHHISAGHVEELEPKPSEPASFSELIATGSDTYNFVTLSNDNGPTNYVGRDTLTGKQVVIDGVTLDETTYDIKAIDDEGTVVWSSKGREFISRDFRVFLSGKGTVTTQTDSFDLDGTPVQFIKPGEPGFLSIKPKFGCGALMSAAPELQEYSHDNI